MATTHLLQLDLTDSRDGIETIIATANRIISGKGGPAICPALTPSKIFEYSKADFAGREASTISEAPTDIFNITDLYNEIRCGGGVNGMGLLERSISTFNPSHRVVSLQ